MDSTFGERLRELRRSTGLNQADFAATGGVKRNSQVEYEAGKIAPNTDYLRRLLDQGHDVAYLLTGVRGDAKFSPAETKLVDRFRRLDPERQETLLKLVDLMQPHATSPPAAREGLHPASPEGQL